MNAPRAIILALFAAGSTMSMPLPNTAAGPSSQLSRRDNPELSAKQQQWAYQMRNLNNEYRTGIASLDSERQMKVEEKAGRLEKEIAYDEDMPYTPVSGTGVFDQLDILAQDDNVKKLSLDREQLERLEELQNDITDEISGRHTEHHIANPQRQEFAETARQEVRDWQAEIEKLDSHGQAEELKKVREFVKSLAKREKKPYTKTSGMEVFDQARELLEDDNFGEIALKYLKEHHRLTHEEKSTDKKIAHEEKHHSETKRSLQARDSLELNTKQQDYAYAARQALQDWRTEIEELDAYAKEKELGKVRGFVKSLAKREGAVYVPSPGMEIFDEADKLLDDENVAKLALKYLKEHHRLDHQSKEVYKVINKEEKHHSVAYAE
ncbi:hypothetical protein FRB96_004067 [Tulasnella sp. 330]|nr:hypothetical protein FRB96_004067 [Tulasnella sp. 330]KAG8871345.1 hypothetical protein FRB97_008777 [Tulasnella sp. 331]KAG8873635.1 hypothetical protein FRB98_008878 [Tulasnella sp. 332]